MIAAGVGIALNKFSPYAYLGFALLILAFNLSMHIPAMISTPEALAQNLGKHVDAGFFIKQMNTVVTMMNFLIIGMSIALAGHVNKEHNS